MNADSQLRTLRQFANDAPNLHGQASAWSLQKISGEIHEFSLELVVEANDWFLIPH